MGSYNAAKNALAALDGSDVGGREMLVKFSVETLNSPPMRRRTIYYEGPHKVYVGNLW
ncbi:putative nucleotide-binding alpha-beta plait domain-containing protein [Medicago truncatula]|nr:putative nucleotide-binding alpha-beta plait domain-containing protein [Medicago truncatula]